MLKRCSVCKIKKKRNQFHKRFASPDGLMPLCKKCNCAKSKSWQETHQEEIAAYRRAYREKNGRALSQKSREYYAANVEKLKKQRKAYRDNNKEIIAASNKAYYDANRGKVLERTRNWALANKERVARIKRAWYDRNREKVREADRQRAINDKKRLSEYYKAWRKSNLDIRREHNQKRRANKRNSPGNGVSVMDWRTLTALYRNQCVACGTSGKMTMDHVVPLSRGGAHSIENIQPLCRSCNSMKHTNATDYRIGYT